MSLFQNILVPLDGSPLAEAALPLAVDVAQRFQANLLLFQVSTEPTLMTQNFEYQHIPVLIEQYEKMSEEYLRPLAQRLGANYEYLRGNPATMILQRAGELRGALIVMSSHGRTGIERWLLGSVAERVARHAPCPVMLVRGKSSE